MTDIFEEVDEELRTDKVNEFWKRYWPYVLGAALLIIAVVAGKSWLDHQSQKEIELAGVAYEDGLAALDAEDIQTARAKLKTVMTEKSGFAKLSGQVLAEGELSLSGDSAAAADALSMSAAQGDGPLSQIASLKAAYIRSDSMSLEELEAKVSGLLTAGGGVGALARELIAAKALQSGDIERARKEFNALKLSLDAPAGVQERAQEASLIMPEPTATSSEDAPAQNAAHADTNAAKDQGLSE